MSAQYVRTYYKVPAKRGMQITVDGQTATIVGFAGARLRIRITGKPGVYVAHPSWRVTYPKPEA